MIIGILAQLIALSPLTINGPNTQRDKAELTPSCDLALLENCRLKSNLRSASCLNRDMTRRSFLRRVRLIITAYGTVVSCVVGYEYMFMLIVKYNQRSVSCPHETVNTAFSTERMILLLNTMIIEWCKYHDTFLVE